MVAGEAKRKKQNKKNENETKNIFSYCLDGIKECNGQFFPLFRLRGR